MTGQSDESSAEGRPPRRLLQQKQQEDDEVADEHQQEKCLRPRVLRLSPPRRLTVGWRPKRIVRFR